MNPSEDVLTIDPVAMNVINRVAHGTSLMGELSFEGGVLVQGRLGGDIFARGRVIVWAGGLLKGQVRILGDLYLFGQLGELGADDDETDVECQGTVYIASTGVSTGSLAGHRLRLYEGADLQGPFTTLRASKSVPILRESPVPMSEMVERPLRGPLPRVT